MGQLGFFDLIRRYESLDEKSDPLVAIAAMVPFESFRSKLKAALRSTISPTIRRNTSFRDRLSFMRFLGLELEDTVPDARLCGSIARRWGKRARWKSCLICLTGC